MAASSGVASSSCAGNPQCELCLGTGSFTISGNVHTGCARCALHPRDYTKLLDRISEEETRLANFKADDSQFSCEKVTVQLLSGAKFYYEAATFDALIEQCWEHAEEQTVQCHLLNADGLEINQANWTLDNSKVFTLLLEASPMHRMYQGKAVTFDEMNELVPPKRAAMTWDKCLAAPASDGKGGVRT